LSFSPYSFGRSLARALVRFNQSFLMPA
jgi:hypothetical protein